MSETLTLASSNEQTSLVAAGRGSFYQRLLLRVLRGFPHGCLRITWPDGSSQLFGEAGLTEPTAEVRLRRPAAFFRRCVLYGNIGLGESFVDGDWDSADLAAVVTWFIHNVGRMPRARGSSCRIPGINFLQFFNKIGHWMRPNSLRVSRRNIAEHYDLGNDFYQLWLDGTMTYSAARFTRSGQSLEEAQTDKYEALCQKLRLRASDHVLEIGCGWGGFSCHAARTYGCRVTAITISEEQYRFATERVKGEGLEDRVEIRLQDYRLLTGQFDKIASIEMLEAVGDQYLETYFAKCHELLTPQGMLAFQVITVPDCRHATLRQGVDWIQKHIFPGSLLLSVARFNGAIKNTGNLFMHEMEDLGASYAQTLQLWWRRFNQKLPEVRQLGFDERFVRMWNYYLQYCEAAFATRNISVVQACYTRPHNSLLHQTWSE